MVNKSNKKKFDLYWHKDVNETWCATAYFVDYSTSKVYAITTASAPDVKVRIAKDYAEHRLNDYATEFLAAKPQFTRVEKDEFDKYYWANRQKPIEKIFL